MALKCIFPSVFPHFLKFWTWSLRDAEHCLIPTSWSARQQAATQPHLRQCLQRGNKRQAFNSVTFQSCKVFQFHYKTCYFCCQGVEAQVINRRLQQELLERETQQMYDLKNSEKHVTVSIIYILMTDSFNVFLDMY